MLTVAPLATVSTERAVAALTAGFSGYLIPFAMTQPQFEARFRGEQLDPYASHLWSADGEPAAILLIARRGWASRVAAVGVSPAFRGTGLGAETMRVAVAEARARGDTRLVLEVFEANAPALKLYRRAGFAAVRKLWGFTLDADRRASPDAAPAREVDPARGAALAGRFRMDDLPWQLEPATLAATVRPTRCFVDGDEAIVAIVDTPQDKPRLRALAFDANITAIEAASFTTALCAAFPGRAWTAPQIYPDAHRTRFFEPGGWVVADLAQFELCHPLTAA